MSEMISLYDKICSYRNADRVLMVTISIIFGIFLIVSASGQEPGSIGPDLAGNQPPTIMSFLSDPQSPQDAGVEVKWIVNAFDQDDDALEYMFLLKGPATGDSWKDMTGWINEPRWVWRTSDNDVGSNEIEVRVRDGYGDLDDGYDVKETARYVINRPVPPNRPPQLTGLVASPESPQVAGTVVVWTASASDPDGDALEYQFVLDGNVVRDWSGDNTWAWSTREQDIGVHAITAGVRDNRHATNGTADSTVAEEYEILRAAVPENVTAPVNVTENVTAPVNITVPINVTPPVSEESVVLPVMSISGYTFNDLNGNGVMDSGEAGLDGWTIVLTMPNQTEVQTTTGFDGYYRFDGLSPGLYTVRELAKAGWDPTTSENQQVNLTDSDVTGINFGNRARTYSISGTLFDDKNNNGVNDSEPGVKGWEVRLTRPDATESVATTGEDGSYRFENLTPGVYTLRVVLQAGWNASVSSKEVSITDADQSGMDFGVQMIGFTISGRVFSDLDANGANDGEPGLSGWTVKLTMPDGSERTAVTAGDGFYSFDRLGPGSYKVEAVKQDGWSQTAPKTGAHTVEVKDSSVPNIDFGYAGLRSISGMVFNDINANGVRDEGESGVRGWSVTLVQGGNVTAMTETGADGSYKFEGLSPGNYRVEMIPQDGWRATTESKDIQLETADVSFDIGVAGSLSIKGMKYYDLNANKVRDEGEPGIPGSEVVLAQNGKIIRTTRTGEDGSYMFDNVPPGTYEIDDPQTVVVTTTVSVVVTDIPVLGNCIISGRKFNDLNGNGAYDAGEPGIAGWHIVLLGTNISTTTNETGSYKFEHVPAGTYTVSEIAQTGWTPTTPASYTITLSSGESKTGLDFGNRYVLTKAAIYGLKFNDKNNNGVRDAGEQGLPGWEIKISNSTYTRTAITDSYGRYNFTGLDAGTYTVTETLKPGWSNTKPGGGSYTITLSAGEAKTGVDFGNYKSPPTGATLTPDKPSPQNVGTTIVWTASATSTVPLEYSFWLKGPSTSGLWQERRSWSSDNTWSWNTAGLQPGAYDVRVWIRDNYHSDTGDIQVTKSFTLKETNRPPHLRLIMVDRPSPQYPGAWVSFRAVAHDPERDPLQYKFLLKGPSTGYTWMEMTSWTSRNIWTWKTSFFDIGYNEIMVYVKDGKHSPEYDDKKICGYMILGFVPRPNLPPVITSFGSSLPSPQYAGSTVTWSATAIDPEGYQVYYRFMLNGPSTGYTWRVVQDWSLSNTWTWRTSDIDIGRSQVIVQIRDGLHAPPTGWDDQASAAFSIVVKPNLPPVIASLTPDKPSPQYSGTQIKWTAVATDPERDQIYYRFWLKGPSTENTWQIVRDWSTSNTWTWSSDLGDAGDYTVFVYARDGKHATPNSYDSAKGQVYRLLQPRLDIVTGAQLRDQIKDSPRLISTDRGFVLVCQSWERGRQSGGDIRIQTYDASMKPLSSKLLTSDAAYQDRPSVVYDGKNYYVAYVSKEKGNMDIFMKKLDQSLNVLETRQLTTSASDQDSPALLKVDNDFLLVYQSWESGRQSGGDIYLTRFNSGWNPLSSIRLTADSYYQDIPSIVLASGYIYVSYVSEDRGNLDVVVKKLDTNLNLLDTRRLTAGSADEDQPYLLWSNGEFMLVYKSEDGISLERYRRDWSSIEKRLVLSGDLEWPSIAYGGGRYWLSYLEGNSIYAMPLKITSAMPPCDVRASFSSRRANRDYLMTLRFYNNYGELTDPTSLKMTWSPQDAARQGSTLNRVATGMYRMRSTFGAPGEKSFRITATIDGSQLDKTIRVTVR
ncbi:MAG: carboxypeptidase regulatory-like domain-containing protein [Methanothrix sp.]|nr:SdrD B-like domain-containing protein [Methanothrix sp.]MCX8207147.1 carboxypeptidase regulatory-like domain-containing protein [Methanothrix sp.]